MDRVQQRHGSAITDWKGAGGALDIAIVYTNMVPQLMDRHVTGFEWDKGNIDHCRKHGVSRAEIEDLFTRPVTVLPDHGHSQNERRYRAVGRTEEGRALFLVFTIREREGRRYIRPVSARYMHREEVESYEKENPDLSDR